ncbi:MAG TPA: hypothetical protein VIJ17_02940 [Pseudolabrys sp.]
MNEVQRVRVTARAGQGIRAPNCDELDKRFAGDRKDAIWVGEHASSLADAGNQSIWYRPRRLDCGEWHPFDTCRRMTAGPHTKRQRKTGLSASIADIDQSDRVDGVYGIY